MTGRLLILTLLFALSQQAPVLAQSGEDELCMDCHDDRKLTATRNGREISLFVNYGRFEQSVHAKEGCVSCHADVDPDDLPHEDYLEPVDCSMCHDKAVTAFEGSLHGQALAHGRTLAPTCGTCHGKHDILPSRNEKAKTYVMNVPALCGTCHKEGTSVSELRTMSQDVRHVLEDYSESIHGEGLLKRGLIVTAICTSCHNSHDILPHENPASSIHRDNVPKTCMQCHKMIEEVHVKVVDGELWEKRPHEIPVCVDCHKTHVVQRVFYERSFPDNYCLNCHADPALHRDGESLYVDQVEAAGSVHREVSCINCHTNADFHRDPVCRKSGPVDCSMCHAEEVNLFAGSRHGRHFAEQNPNAPYCTTCHGTHGTLSSAALASPTFPRNVPDLCGNCHRDGEKAAVLHTGEERHIVKNYSMSIHGKGLTESGLLVTATCVSCHTAHSERPASEPESTVHPDNIAQTCAQCHLGIYEAFKSSIHSPELTVTEKELPVCNDCHQSHTIHRVDQRDFRQGIMDQCGRCHEDVTDTYFDSFHGKVSILGEVRTAKCYDCHGSHGILPTDHPASTLSSENVVETCRQCHPNSNYRFAGYIAHADHHDRDRYPFLFYTFWAMTVLLVSVFTFFGIHTMLWLPRSVYERWKMRGGGRGISN